ncbi:hypothetical protein TNIN_103851 [Trichonephila inaurata madagascariensis]|uniref:Uncharacterized protein n=1 Tax=Trichonephila inaurata madagascariensis TaxID=2747483 RepID=A0A8X6YCX7_9ARAC|nr:hypothetical protein TNIN_103851 [Trichonephila inaurata madagascariensis]
MRRGVDENFLPLKKNCTATKLRWKKERLFLKEQNMKTVSEVAVDRIQSVTCSKGGEKIFGARLIFGLAHNIAAKYNVDTTAREKASRPSYSSWVLKDACNAVLFSGGNDL